ncbi:MAG: transposase [Deltaproteobacteria bacterium]|nr:transposase [Deltaproteobacteria bacterium]
MTRSRYKTIKDTRTYFVTCTITGWQTLLNRPRLAEIILDSLRFTHCERRIVLHAYVLMENHFHLVGSSDHFSDEVRKLKSYTARMIVDRLKKDDDRATLAKLKVNGQRTRPDQEYRVWEEGFHPKAITDEAILRQKIEYIHNNPVRRGYVDIPEHWRYSSARQYVGSDGLVPVEIIV